MKEIVSKKINALNNIFNSYEIYKGNLKSKLEIEINNLKEKLSEEDYSKLVVGLQSYKHYLFNVLAQTRRVFIKFDENEKQETNFEDLDKIFEDIDNI